MTGPDARQECPCSNDPDGWDPMCDVHGNLDARASHVLDEHLHPEREQ